MNRTTTNKGDEGDFHAAWCRPVGGINALRVGSAPPATEAIRHIRVWGECF